MIKIVQDGVGVATPSEVFRSVQELAEIGDSAIDERTALAAFDVLRQNDGRGAHGGFGRRGLDVGGGLSLRLCDFFGRLFRATCDEFFHARLRFLREEGGLGPCLRDDIGGVRLGGLPLAFERSHEIGRFLTEALGLGEQDFLVATTSFSGEDGRVTTLHAAKADPQNPFGPPVPGTEFEIKADLVLLAMGFLGPEYDGFLEQLGVETDDRSNVVRDQNYMTALPGVFVAGDAGRGQSLIVWAIAEGRAAANGVDTYLMETPSRLPRPVNPTDRPLVV